MTFLDMQDLQYLISRARLTGGRGFYERYKIGEEPVNSDHDWTIWCDIEVDKLHFRKIAERLCASNSNFKIVDRWDGFTLHSQNYGVDVNVYPSARGACLMLAWELMAHRGLSKLEAWRLAHEQLNYRCED